MYLRDLVKSLWAQAGLYERKDAKLQSFLKAVDTFPLECWDDFGARFRSEYYDLFDQLIPPLAASSDRLLHVLLIRMADLKQPKEMKLAVDFVQRADPAADRAELNALLHRKDSKIDAAFRKRSALVPVIDPPPVLKRMTTNITVPQPAKKPAVKKKVATRKVPARR